MREAHRTPGDHRIRSCKRRRRCAATLIELLVVLFIMGVMMSLLLPALNGARNQAQAKVCQSNIHQLGLALGQAIEAKKKFPDPTRWTVELLPWIEQRPLADLMKYNTEPNPKFPRPPLMICPMQDERPSRVESVGACHYVLVVDRLPNGEVERGWGIQDVPLPFTDAAPEPWYVGPEISYAIRELYFSEKPGPHPPGLYMTSGGLRPQ